jgi:hypothetical protein
VIFKLSKEERVSARAGTAHVQSRVPSRFLPFVLCQADTTRTRSKLRLVDLAGSERVSKANSRGLQVKEGKPPAAP